MKKIKLRWEPKGGKGNITIGDKLYPPGHEFEMNEKDLDVLDPTITAQFARLTKNEKLRPADGFDKIHIDQVPDDPPIKTDEGLE